jgi:hypothetical protein
MICQCPAKCWDILGIPKEWPSCSTEPWPPEGLSLRIRTFLLATCYQEHLVWLEAKFIHYLCLSGHFSATMSLGHKKAETFGKCNSQRKLRGGHFISDLEWKNPNTRVPTSSRKLLQSFDIWFPWNQKVGHGEDGKFVFCFINYHWHPHAHTHTYTHMPTPSLKISIS